MTLEQSIAQLEPAITARWQEIRDEILAISAGELNPTFAIQTLITANQLDAESNQLVIELIKTHGYNTVITMLEKSVKLT